ncbi:MAG: glycosyltransferase family 2 protein [Candidatus Levyibacteriota bacterium]
MNISIVIPNYNGEDLLQKNLPTIIEAVKDYKEGNVEIIIADDPSTDNSQHVIAEFIKSISHKHIIAKTISNRNKKEAGFSKNVNRGVSLATGDVLILLNTDVAPHKDFLQPLLKHFKDENTFAVGCMDESHEGNEIILRGRGTARWQRGFVIHAAGSLDKANTFWVSGGSGAFRKRIWDTLGGLDELYNPFYWEDIDLSYRALKSGYKVIFEKESIVAHEHSKGSIKTQFAEKGIKTIAYRNQFIFTWKNITDKKLIQSHYKWLPYHFLKALLNRDDAFFNGYFSALAVRSKINKSKLIARKLFVKHDEDVLQAFHE